VVRFRSSSLVLALLALIGLTGSWTCGGGKGRRASRGRGQPVVIEESLAPAEDSTPVSRKKNRHVDSAAVSPAALRRLGGELRDTSRAVAMRAADRLSDAGVAAVPILMEALADTARQTRVVAAYGLGEVGPEARNSVPILVRYLSSADDSVANMADWAITQIQPKAGPYVALLRGLRFGDPFERADAARLLSHYGEGAIEAMPLLLRAFQDSDPLVARNAGAALIAIGPRATPAVEALISSPNPTIRLRAMMVLGRMRPSYF
jgi:HEAT repeat protein